jgi:hypothetical protein
MTTDTTIEGAENRPLGTSRALCAAAIVSFIVGVALSCYTIRLETGAFPTLQRKVHDLQRLGDMQAELKRGLDAVKAFEAAGTARKPAPLTDIMKETLEGLQADDIKDIRKDTVQGWAIRQKQLAFNDAPMGRVMAFLNKAENASPPWRLTKCSIRSSPRVAGSARIELTLEAVEKVQ